MLVMAFSFSYSPTLFFIGIGISFILASWMGFVALTDSLLTAIIAILAIAIHKVKS